METDKLIMKFDPNTILHLGVQMYSTLPPVVAEIISNAYDAEATEVQIELYDQGDKKIIVSDNGHGMSFDEINAEFLIIGRNRRDFSQKSRNKVREVIGKKGIGKLAFFGIAENIKVETVNNNLRNTFVLDLETIRKQGNEGKEYEPEIIEKNKSIEQKQGTKITLSKINRKTAFSPLELAESLAKTFQIFDEPDFNVVIKHNNSLFPEKINNKFAYRSIKEDLVWHFPKKLDLKEKYNFDEQIKGKIISAKETVPADMRGIALFSRGKLANKYELYDLKATSYGYEYITGWLEIDFIENFSKDVISTNRQSLNWEVEETTELKNYIQEIIQQFYTAQREFKKENKIILVEKEIGFKLNDWHKELPKHEKKLAEKITTSIVNAEGIDIKKSAELITFSRDAFKFQSFKELADEINETNIQNPEKIIELFKEWKIIESREMYKIAKVRLETIKKFDFHIKNNSREVPELHNFLKQFPWLLDPRIMDFKDEVTYSQMLKENFKDLFLDDNDRRIDFLCQNFADSFFIIELKRPKKRIGEKELNQALDYISFIKEKLGNEYGTNIYCYIIGDRLVDTDKTRMIADSYKNSRVVYLKTYESLLANASKYHQEFIDKYSELEKKI